MRPIFLKWDSEEAKEVALSSIDKNKALQPAWSSKL
jgi:hypothetical protein